MRAGFTQVAADDVKRPRANTAIAGCSLLVTGFGRFPGVQTNPTTSLVWRVTRLMNKRSFGGLVTGKVLTVSYAAALPELDASIHATCPDAMLLLGLAGSAREVRVERYGRLGNSPLQSDATGKGGTAHAAGTGRPLAATAALQPALAVLQAGGVRAKLSHSAGRYLCNAVYAAALSQAAGRPVLFVHIPYPRPAPGTRPRNQTRSWRPSPAQLEQSLSRIGLQLALASRRLKTSQSPMA